MSGSQSQSQSQSVSAPQSEAQLPSFFCCPISLELMEDPVVDEHGHTYDRSHIIRWLKANGNRSPLNNLLVDPASLKPNFAIRDAIDLFKKEHAIQGRPLPQAAAASSAAPITISSISITVDSTPQPRVDRSAVDNRSSCELVALPADEGEGEGESTASAGAVVAAAISWVDSKADERCLALQCIVDVSGSMNENVASGGAAGDEGDDSWMTKLDLVKHSMHTIVAALRPRDRFSLVKFSTHATTVLTWTVMDERGKSRCRAAIDALEADGSTNLWDGIRQGLDMFDGYKLDGVQGVSFLLTDGLPNVDLNRTYADTIRSHIATKPSSTFTPPFMQTFGFGYGIDSKLLTEISSTLHGVYSFIPDFSFVGTVLIHAIANALTLSHIQPTLVLSSDKLDDDATTCRSNSRAQSIKIPLRLLCRDQTVMAHVDVASFNEAESIASDVIQVLDRKDETLLLAQPNSAHSRTSVDRGCALVAKNRARLALLQAVRDAHAKGCALLKAKSAASQWPKADMRDIVQRACDQIKRWQSKLNGSDESKAATPFIEAVLAELNGQITMAVADHAAFQKWGQHYLPSVVDAHDTQTCNNFKDPAVQFYGSSAAFRSLRDHIDTLFCQLPPPKPPVAVSSQPSYVPMASMRTYLNVSGGCVSGGTLATVLVDEGEGDKVVQVPVRELKGGDRILSSSGKYMKIRLVERFCSGDDSLPMEMVQFVESGLEITHYHPVRIDGKWLFPINADGVKRVQRYEPVFTFVLEGAGEADSDSNDHSVVLNGMHVITLGHGSSEPVAQHSFFGTAAIVRDLECLYINQGGKDGIVNVTLANMVRGANDTVVALR